MNPDTPFPDVQSSTDPKTIPWHMAIVWSDRSVNGQRLYEWLSKEHVRLVNWSNGLVTIQLNEDSKIGRDVMYFVISASFVAIGKNMPV